MAYEYPRFVARCETYLNDQSPELERLKALVSAAPEREHVAAFRSEFSEILERQSVSRQEFRRICGQDFDTDEEYRSWLKALWCHLFEDGPAPPV